MSYPVEADFALIQRGDGGSPSETFSILCGIESVGINRVANTNDRFRRDCAKPGEVPVRKVRVTGKQLDITGSGAIDKSHIAIFNEALGDTGNYKVELFTNDGTDTGVLMGAFAGAFVLTAANVNISQGQDATAEVTLASHGAWTWAAA
jgi:hypothetical protein